MQCNYDAVLCSAHVRGQGQVCSVLLDLQTLLGRPYQRMELKQSTMSRFCSLSD